MKRNADGQGDLGHDDGFQVQHVPEEIDRVADHAEVLEVHEQPDVAGEPDHKDRGFQLFVLPEPLDQLRAGVVHHGGEKQDQHVLRDEGHVEIAGGDQQKVPAELVRQKKINQNDEGEKEQKFDGIEQHVQCPL